MADLKTNYLGLKLKNPIIAASCGLTENLKSIREIYKNGAAAIVLKSIFEEEITHEYEALTLEANHLGYKVEFADYLDYVIREKNIVRYTQLIKEIKSEMDIPIIASINCFTTHEWEFFAHNCEKAGADAIELNIFISPSEMGLKSETVEKKHFDIIEKIQQKVKIPISIKISPFFSNLSTMIQDLSKTGIAGIVLFNRFFSPDIDIDKLELIPSFIYSQPEEITLPLKWISLMAKKVDCGLAASTGIHDGNGVIKQILVGASAVQLSTVLYTHGTKVIKVMLKTIEEWMIKKGYKNLDQFRGLMSQSSSSDPAMYERVQFMKYFRNDF